ncbi:hypothetical protein DW900_12700 [Blautia obeum]|nr:hypothetical protein DW900_12700 [Blautia obeum]RHP99331.1 hypothetical protein DXA19_00110 [Firmicutes bacterium AM59-13]
MIFQSCCGNQRTTSNSSDFAPIWLLGAQIKIKKEPITAVFQTAYYRLCVCASALLIKLFLLFFGFIICIS